VEDVGLAGQCEERKNKSEQSLAAGLIQNLSMLRTIRTFLCGFETQWQPV